MRRKLVSISMMFFVFLLISCGNENRVPDIVKNISAVEETSKQLNLLTTIDTEGLVVYNEYLHWGLLQVRGSSNKMGVFSLLENKLIVPFQENVSISITSDSIFRAYIKVNYFSNAMEIYDINGRKIVNKDSYATASVVGSKVANYDDKGKFINYDYFETVTTLTSDDLGKGLSPNVTKYKVNLLTQERVIWTSEENYNFGDQYNSDDTNRHDLDIYGLKGYYYKFFGNTMYVYKNNSNKLIQTIIIPTTGTGTFFDGHFIYQIAYRVDQFNDKYTFITNGEKYILKTVAIDLLTGKEKNLNVDYKISSIQPFKDKDEINNFGLITMNKITSKVLQIDITYKSIINIKGQVIEDVSRFNFNSLTKLDENHIVDYTNKLMLDKELNVLYQLPSSFDIVYSEKVIILKNSGFAGVIDYDGKVVVQFDYNYISTDFYNSKTYGRDKNNQSVLINLENSTNVINDSSQVITKGLLFTYNDVKNSNNLFEGKIINYDGHSLLNLELSNTTIQTIQVDNPFGLYTIVRFNVPNGYKYVSILNSKPE